MAANQLPKVWTVKQLADLVKQLRIVQKASGVGYKTATASSAAKPLEEQVDAAIAEIEVFHIF
jgi:uncharacterized lipoprotein YmbA